jgi:copper chaperone NosL
MNQSKDNEISTISKITLLITGISLVVSIFVPLWRIDLDAPQYPEGLYLLIYSYKLAGNVDIINGLNHYIGMKTLHTEDFIEFTVLPYIIGFFAMATFLTAIVGKKKIVYILLIAFILFGILSMIDFWRWEYNYGHHLDPNAAIIVPGMAYQPPLIGFKQLLNFGAYSMPSVGGWLFVISGLLMVTVTLIETKALNRFKRIKKTTAMLFVFIVGFSKCSNSTAQQIELNKDNCDNCKMTIADGRFAAELITQKGRVYKFDDLSCMIEFASENKKTTIKLFFVSDYLGNNSLIPAETAYFIKGDLLKSPMRGNMAAFTSEEKGITFLEKFKAVPINWSEIKPK